VALRNEKGEKLRIQLTQLLWVSGETALIRPMLYQPETSEARMVLRQQLAA
jgi:hypothetical protein